MDGNAVMVSARMSNLQAQADDNLVGLLTTAAVECPQRRPEERMQHPEIEQTGSMTNMAGTVVALGETTKPTNDGHMSITIATWIDIATPRPSGATAATSDMAAVVDCKMKTMGLIRIDTTVGVDASRVIVSEVALPLHITAADARAEIRATHQLHPHQHRRLHRHLHLPAEAVTAAAGVVVDLVRINWLQS
jgi:hypothetical protein